MHPQRPSYWTTVSRRSIILRSITAAWTTRTILNSWGLLILLRILITLPLNSPYLRLPLVLPICRCPTITSTTPGSLTWITSTKPGKIYSSRSICRHSETGTALTISAGQIIICQMSYLPTCSTRWSISYKTSALCITLIMDTRGGHILEKENFPSDLKNFIFEYPSLKKPEYGAGNPLEKSMKLSKQSFVQTHFFMKT